MERSEIRDKSRRIIPHSASLHAGYQLYGIDREIEAE
jgi:hypothetical protein